MRWWCIAVALAGCGRLHFGDHADGGGGDSAGSDVLTGHDEDGDGVPDAIDVCPHLPGSQADGDGDGVGDDCDPEPAIGRQHLALFATMQPGDQPFTLSDMVDWTQEADQVRFNGVGGTQARTMLPAYQSIRASFGFEIESVMGAGIQHQIALHTASSFSGPQYFVELNELGNSRAQITFYDGTNYTPVSGNDLANGMHTGRSVIQATGNAGGSLVLDGGWLQPAELYHVTADATFPGGTFVFVDVNNIELELRYAWIITW
jgi:hypothetical protein